MMNSHRRFNIGQVRSLPELAEKLTKHTWTLCTGFEYTHQEAGKRRTFYFFNDAFSEDGAGEFAVYTDGVQIESWTASWMSEAEVINECFPALLKIEPRKATPNMPRMDHGDQSCQLCA
jgi:hypothetical protein